MSNQELDVGGVLKISGSLKANNLLGNFGEVLTSNGQGVFWGPGGVSSVIIDSNIPTTTYSGALWWDSEEGNLKVYYNDGDTAQWVSATSSIVNNNQGGSATIINSTEWATIDLIGNTQGSAMRTFSYSTSNYPITAVLRARGTFQSPQAVTSGDWLGTFETYGRDTANAWIRGPYMRAEVSGTVSSGVVPAQWVINTNNTDRMIIRNDGIITVNASNPNGIFNIRSAGDQAGLVLDNSTNSGRIHMYAKHPYGSNIARIESENAVLQIGSRDAYALHFITGNNFQGSIASNGFITFTGVANYTNTNPGNVYVDASTGALYRSISSIRYKANVENYVPVDNFHSLRPVIYKGKDDPNSRYIAGLIAEEVHEAGYTEFVLYNKDGEPDALHYQNMVALLIYETKILKQEVNNLKQEIISLKTNSGS